MRSVLVNVAVVSTLLFNHASAVPSSSHGLDYQQHSFRDVPTNTRSTWRRLTDRVIEKLWRFETQSDDGRLKRISDWQDPPAQTRSRHGEDILIRFNISSIDEVEKLAHVADYMYLDVWETSDEWVDIRMAKDTLPLVLKTLPASMQHSHTALLQEKELAQAIFDTYPSSRKAVPLAQSEQPTHARFYTPSLHSPSVGGAESNIFFQDYQPLSVIHPWMRLLASLFTTHVRIINIGTSYEGREILALRVGNHPTNSEERPQARKTILITGGLHAREWVSTSTVNFLAYSLITGYGKSSEITHLLQLFDFIFVPTTNPDGYVYTWETDRLWRKNRQHTPSRFCHGLDLDRAFAYHWAGASTSGNPCSESYAGESAFEALEARALADWARNETVHNNVEFVGLLDLHSYSEQILYPYSYSCDAEPANVENLEELATGLAKAIRVNSGLSFQVRQACEGNVGFSAEREREKDSGEEGEAEKRPVKALFELGGGSALDWFYHELHVHYAYQVKLRDRGSYGFLLPREYIVPSGKEMLDAVLYFGKYLSGEMELAGKDEAEVNKEEAVKVKEAIARQAGNEPRQRTEPKMTERKEGEEAKAMVELR